MFEMPRRGGIGFRSGTPPSQTNHTSRLAASPDSKEIPALSGKRRGLFKSAHHSIAYLAARARNRAAISSNPLASAPSSAVAPALVRSPASAPRASSNSTTSRRPHEAALYRSEEDRVGK